jgi:hypothetical protein
MTSPAGLGTIGVFLQKAGEGTDQLLSIQQRASGMENWRIKDINCLIVIINILCILVWIGNKLFLFLFLFLFLCVSGIRHFRFMLEGRPFRIYTDHKPPTYALSRSSEPWTACQCCHLSYVAEFSSEICHMNDKDNLVADTLSRPPAGATTLIGPSPVVVRLASVKSPSGSLATMTAAGMGPTAGQHSQQVDFAAMAAHLADCI